MTKTQRTRTWQSRRWPGRLPSSPLDCQRRRLVAGGNRSSVPALFLRLKFTLPKMPIPAPMVRSCVTCSPGRHLPTLLRTKVPTLTPSVLHRRRRPLWRCLAARPRCRCPHPQRFFCRRLCRSSSRASRQPLPNCCHSSASEWGEEHHRLLRQGGGCRGGGQAGHSCTRRLSRASAACPHPTLLASSLLANRLSSLSISSRARLLRAA